ncbi:MAG: hypothetical protein JNL63_11095, partial [Bacteroidia bacterium]|nr:hypothetical protein [Bacteroidia bacterium]
MFKPLLKIKRYFLVGVFFFSLFSGAGYLNAQCNDFTINGAFAFTNCAVVPSAWQAFNFNIRENNGGHNDCFASGAGKTMIITLPVGFEFRTTALGGTPTITFTAGRDITAITFTAATDMTANTLTFTVSLGGIANRDQIFFNNIEIRAITQMASGNLVRSGGTFVIDGSTGCPTAAQEFGTLDSYQPQVSNAGPDQTVCATTATLAGNTPTQGSGTWTRIAGTGSITTPSSPTSGITGLTSGASSTFRWTITNGTCAASTDDVVITVSPLPTTSNAGADINVCNVTTATLNGNNPAAGVGLWSVVSGTATITTPALRTSGVTGLVVGTSATLRWTITLGACTSTDDVVVTSLSLPTSNAGPDQTVCTSTATLTGSSPSATGSGTWTRTSGTGAITTPSSPTSGVTGLTSGASSTFRWTVTDAPCANATDDVIITYSPPTAANAGTDQSLCGTTTTTLAGNTPVLGTGSWSVVSGTATITTPSSPTSTVTGLVVGASATLRWTTTLGSCTSTDDVVITSLTPITYVSSSVSQYSTGPINLACADASSEILQIKVVVSGSNCVNVTQFNFNTTGDAGYSENPATNITSAKVYFTDTIPLYGAGTYPQYGVTTLFGTTAAPNGAFSVTGSATLSKPGTYYFYLNYVVPGTATIGNKLDASLTSFVIGGVTKSDMTTPNPTGTRTITNTTCFRPDMPNPVANLQSIPINSLIIPMDNNLQLTTAGTPLFNLKAYGLVNALLQNDIPVKWVIKSGKAKDATDFTANAKRVYPSAVATALKTFISSAFIVDSTYVNKAYYSTGLTATQVITAFEATLSATTKVNVYQLTDASINVDVRYTLSQRLKVAVFSNGTYQAIHKAYLDNAGISNYDMISAGVFTGLTDCYTFCSEGHWDNHYNDPTDWSDTLVTKKVKDFVNSGGNFLAQCAGVTQYEELHHFMTDNGMTYSGSTITNKYSNAQMPQIQIHGSLNNESGLVSKFKKNGGNYANGYYSEVDDNIVTDLVVATVHRAHPDSTGGNVTYVGGHDYNNGAGSNALINGARVYLNAALVPCRRPTAFTIDPGTNKSICSGSSTTLGGSPTGPATATYAWSPTTGLSDPASANPVASPTVTTTYTLNAFRGACLAGPVTATVTVYVTTSADAGPDQTVCASSPTVTLAGAATGTYSWTGGTGSFVPDRNTLTATYTPSAAELLAGTVTLTLNSTNTACPTVTDQVAITIKA